MAESAELEKLDLPYLLGRLDMLEIILGNLVLQTPERAMRAVEHAADAWGKTLDKDPSGESIAQRRYADGAYDTLGPLRDGIEQAIKELAKGDRIRTIQPATI
ncbi:hypothetical protein [Brucella sp. 10RB9213]|uniref:hypothetical protein n=1 Tax=Brucella sp. 10RB9213 TaxID=1844039 RepID=UPI0012AE2E03|nr:hypothetical protein [Brucella sp. 10RB9213]MRN66567.1 hypothetical protein [Brucella sp. 10RB9213]